jgi:hypothetical protein
LGKEETLEIVTLRLIVKFGFSESLFAIRLLGRKQESYHKRIFLPKLDLDIKYT